MRVAVAEFSRRSARRSPRRSGNSAEGMRLFPAIKVRRKATIRGNPLKTVRRSIWILSALLLIPAAGFCGGAWVPDPGKGDIELGFSRKTASSSWDVDGNAYTNTTLVNGKRVISYHDFRYTYRFIPL